MKSLFDNVKKAFRLIRGFFPEALPVGVAGFEDWAHSLETTYKLPTEDKDSIRFALCTMIMHLGPTTAYKSKFYFFLTLRAGAAKQVAGSCFSEIKERQKALALEAQKKQAEVTALEAVTSNESKQQRI